MTARKRFDRELWLENDKKARNGVKKIFRGLQGFTVKDHSDHRKVDLEVFKNGKHVANVETEIKRVWRTEEFPYESVQFPERKRKFTELEKPTLFIMFNANLGSYVVVTDADLANSPSVEVPNKYVFKDEYFFQVPLDNVFFNEIKKPLRKIGVPCANKKVAKRA